MVDETPPEDYFLEENELEKIAISGFGMCTALGDLGKDVLEAAREFKPVIKPSSDKDLFPDQEAPVHISPIESLRMSPEERIDKLLTRALKGALEYLPLHIESRRVLIYTVLPSKDLARSAFIQPDNLWDPMDEIGSRLHFMARCFGYLDNGSVEHFLLACDFLLQDEVDAVLFGGVDSCINTKTYEALKAQGMIRTDTCVDADALGEGAAYVLLEPVTTTDEKGERPCDLYAPIVSGISYDRDEAVRSASGDARCMSSVIWEALEEAELSQDEIGSVIFPGSDDKVRREAWAMTVKEIWPRLTPEQRQAMKQQAQAQVSIAIPDDRAPETVRLNRVMGNLGAATLPLSLALGYVRLTDRQAPIDSTLVLDTNEQHVRGAICLKRAGYQPHIEEAAE